MIKSRCAPFVGPETRLRAEACAADASLWVKCLAALFTCSRRTLDCSAVALRRAIALLLVATVSREHPAALFAVLWSQPASFARGRKCRDVLVLIALRWASVLCLLKVARPSAIVRRIGTVVIDALKCESRCRPLAHVGDEVCERMPPSIADSDSATAIAMERLRRWIDAALNHGLPSVVFRSVRLQQSVRRLKDHDVILA